MKEVDFIVDKDKKKLEKRSVNITDALANVFNLVNLSIMDRFADPISTLGLILFDKYLNRTKICKISIENCKQIRTFIQSYINKRRSGKAKSTVNDVDMLSLFFENPDVFTDDFIIDELMDFFLAGTLTTQYCT